MTKPNLARMVIYTLSAADAEKINRRRTDSASVAERIGNGFWHPGAQAHIGNKAEVGQKLPMMIVRVHGEAVSSCVNGQVFLDGCDVFWALSVNQDDSGKPGTFAFPVIEAAKPAATAKSAAVPASAAAPAATPATETKSK